jgi:predicted ATPase
MLKRIKIGNYKSLVDLEVELRPLTVLCGPNAAGKSNFLDALQLLSRIATCRTLKEAFEPPYRGKPLESFTFGPEGIQELLQRETAVSFTMEADVELSPVVVLAVNRQIGELRRTTISDGSKESSGANGLSFVRERDLRYRIEVEILPRSGILRVVDEYLAALTAKGQPTGKRKPFLERVGHRLHLRMEGQAHPSYHERHLDHSILSLPLYPPHYPHLVAMRQELAAWLFFYFEPRERMRAPNPVKEVRHIGLMGEELAAFLNTLRTLNEKQFRAVEKSLHLLVPSITGIDVSANNLGEVELRLWEGKKLMPARVISEGTLRVLGLLALGGAKDPPALLGFEEPENGIHPGRIQLVAEYLKTQANQGESQFIVTTHSPLLLDMMPKDSLFICRKRDGESSIEPYPDPGDLFHRQEIREALDDEGEPLPISARILRGDFDA